MRIEDMGNLTCVAWPSLKTDKCVYSKSISELPKGRSPVRVGFRAGFQQLRSGEGVLLPEEATDQQDLPLETGGLLQLAQGGRAQFPRPLLRGRRA